MALLIMRASAAFQLLATAFYAAPISFWISVGLSGLAVALLIGGGTRVVAGATAAAMAIVSLRVGGLLGASAALHAVDAVALALLGAGAYSLDSRLFGRRVITLDP